MSLWPVVTKENPCPICGKEDWCAIGDKAIKCMRITSDRPCASGGWYHSFGTQAPVLRPLPPKRSPHLSINFARLLSEWRDKTNQDAILCHATSLGVTQSSLLSLQICWASQYDAWAFPMRDSSGAIIGARLRAQDGRKWTVAGSRAGLFLDAADMLEGSWIGKTAYVVEGPTDCAAGLMIGLKVIGKPSAGACNDQVKETVRRMRPKDCVILADRDSKINPATGKAWDTGIKEAGKLKDMLSIRTLICPPPVGFKDLREFVKAGGGKTLLESIVKMHTWK